MSARRKGEGGRGGEAGALPPRPQQGALLPAPTAKRAARALRQRSKTRSPQRNARFHQTPEGHLPNGAERVVRQASLK